MKERKTSSGQWRPVVRTNNGKIEMMKINAYMLKAIFVFVFVFIFLCFSLSYISMSILRADCVDREDEARNNKNKNNNNKSLSLQFVQSTFHLCSALVELWREFNLTATAAAATALSFCIYTTYISFWQLELEFCCFWLRRGKVKLTSWLFATDGWRNSTNRVKDEKRKAHSSQDEKQKGLASWTLFALVVFSFLVMLVAVH